MKRILSIICILFFVGCASQSVKKEIVSACVKSGGTYTYFSSYASGFDRARVDIGCEKQ